MSIDTSGLINVTNINIQNLQPIIMDPLSDVVVQGVANNSLSISAMDFGIEASGYYNNSLTNSQLNFSAECLFGD
jgi:hypothetical protein